MGSSLEFVDLVYALRHHIGQECDKYPQVCALVLNSHPFQSGREDTLGALFWDHPEEGLEFLCFTLEDQFQAVKVPGEARIPDGCYPLTLRTYGGMHERYLQRYPSLHKGMIEIREVPGFTHILIHTGNTDDHTAGCLLVGDEVRTNEGKRKGFLGNSRPAYQRLYRQVTWQIEQGHQVILDVVSR